MASKIFDGSHADEVRSSQRPNYMRQKPFTNPGSATFSLLIESEIHFYFGEKWIEHLIIFSSKQSNNEEWL